MTQILELTPHYDSRESFYGKARIIREDNGTERLISYNTEVAVATEDELHIKGEWSQTTTRHVKEFMHYLGLEPVPMSECREAGMRFLL